MKIGVITGLYPTPLYPNGGVFVTRRIATLLDLGCQVDAYALIPQESWTFRKIRMLLHLHPNEELQDWISTDNPLVQFRAIKVPMTLPESVLNVLIKNRLFIHKAQKYMRRVIGEKRYDVIHGHWLYPTGAAVVKYAQSVHTPCVVTAHGSEVHRDMRKKYRKGCLWTLENCTRAEFVSHFLLERAMQYGYSGKNAQVLPNGIINTLSGKRESTGRTVGFVGSLIPVKRADKFPQLFAEIARIMPDVQFVVVGDGALRQQIECETKELAIRFTGRLSQSAVLQEMQKMDVLILPSRNEGFACVVLEAHSCGIPVVGSSNGGIPEGIGDERFVVQEGPNFEQEFIQRVVDVLNNAIPINAEALRERAKTFTWKILQEQELENYRSLR